MFAAPEIEKGVPIPPAHGRSALRDMEIGDSKLFPESTQHTVSAMATKITQQTGHKFTTRKLKEGVRVWRVE
jgi:hypothetical protein